MMLSKFLVLVLPFACFGQLAGGFNYNRCDTTFGPAKWPGMCGMHTSGTPIDLCGAVPFLGCAPVLRTSGYNHPRTLNVTNDGVNVYGVGLGQNPPMLSTDVSLSLLVGRAMVVGPQSWKLQNVHLHWGRMGKSGEGSEHYIDGKQFDGEVHLVHYNSRFANFSQAVASRASDALLVVGVLLKADKSPKEPDAITTFADAVTFATRTPQPLPKAVRISDIFDGTGHFYAYSGSLATPPACAEIVTWIVMKEPKKISDMSLGKLWQASTTPGVPGGELISLHGNYRPLQPLGNRTVYATGKFGDACKMVMEPEFTC